MGKFFSAIKKFIGVREKVYFTIEQGGAFYEMHVDGEKGDIMNELLCNLIVDRWSIINEQRVNVVLFSDGTVFDSYLEFRGITTRRKDNKSEMKKVYMSLCNDEIHNV